MLKSGLRGDDLRFSESSVGSRSRANCNKFTIQKCYVCSVKGNKSKIGKKAFTFKTKQGKKPRTLTARSECRGRVTGV